MKIKIKLSGGNIPIITKEGDWMDIVMPTAGNIEGPYANTLHKNKTIRDVIFNNKLVDLGFAMQLPKGFEAYMLPRSGTYNKFGVDLANTEPVIDNLYNGDKDTWKVNIKAYRTTNWQAGDRLFQMRIMLSQRATFFQKLRWLFWNGKIQFVQVSHLNGKSRGGFGQGTKYLDK